jgi:hypothetical protein
MTERIEVTNKSASSEDMKKQVDQKIHENFALKDVIDQ